MSLQVATSTRPYYYYLTGDMLKLVPTPTASCAGGMIIHHTYCPMDLSCTDNYTPPVPRAHDEVFTNYAIMQAFARDRHAPEAMSQFQAYSVMFNMSFNLLLAQGFAGARLQPIR